MQMDSVKYQIGLIKSTPLFNAAWYEERYPDVGMLGIPPAEHFVRIGARMGRNPSDQFDTDYYLRSNPDVARAGINPLVHYLEHGERENRAITPHVLTATNFATNIEIIIPVYNALEHVKRCLSSVQSHRDGYDIRVLVVNDGSDAETSAWLQKFCSSRGDFSLIQHDENRGYTRAVNAGLRASVASHVITLNSDTIVTRGWLAGMMRCMGSAPGIGIVGPLSNAASWQNVPELLDDSGNFAVNELPLHISPDDMALIVARASQRDYQRTTFVNGFCFMIRREVIDAIGFMDEDSFPLGYGEENDYCIRAADAGFELAIADDAYVFHAKSKSFGHAKREQLSKRGSEILRLKHSPDKYERLVQAVKNTSSMDRVRQRIRNFLHDRTDMDRVQDYRQIRILFVLPVRGGGGGAHSVIQEAIAMRRLGVDVTVAVRLEHLEDFLLLYGDIPDIRDIMIGFERDRIIDIADDFDVVVATIYSSMELVRDICTRSPHILPAYYVQDYEPLFFEQGSKNHTIAVASYGLVANATLFAKTHWLTNRVRTEHGIDVHKVEPSIDHSVYRPKARTVDHKIHVSAMIRPRTPRRGPERTMRVLSAIARKFPGRVDFHLFGCPDEELTGLASDFEFENFGILDRPGVARLLAASDIFVDLSDYQAFGRTALEAMACGATSVVPSHGGADEYAVDGVNALVVDSFNENECIKRISALLSSPVQLNNMQLEALRTAANYSTHKAAVSELGLFSRQLTRHRAIFPKPEKDRLVILPSARVDGVTPTGSAWVRCLLPYGTPDVRQAWCVKRGSRRSLPVPGSADVAILQRDDAGIAKDELEAWLPSWREAGGKMIYEVDDNLLNTQALLDRGFTGDPGEIADSVRWLAENADSITTSTPSLLEILRPFNTQIHFVPNRLDRRLWRLDLDEPVIGQPALRDGGPVRIGFIGTPTHDADLALIAEAMRQVETRYGNRVRIEVIGGYQFSEPRFGVRVPLPRRNDYLNFVHWLFQRANWDVALLPLVDDSFNRCKSYLKFLEYGALNQAIVCSNVVTYHAVARNETNALVVSNDTQAWFAAVSRLIEDGDLRKRLSGAARNMVRLDHTIESAASQYCQILSQFASSRGDTSEEATVSISDAPG